MPTVSEARSAKRVVLTLIDNILSAAFGSALGLAIIIEWLLTP